jgi:hypothetical protein
MRENPKTRLIREPPIPRLHRTHKDIWNFITDEQVTPDAAYGELKQIFKRYYDDPVRFVTDTLAPVAYTGRLGPDPWQCDVLEALLEHRLVAVKSAHGVGKTSCCVFAAYWFLTTRYLSKVPIIAPTFGKQIKAMIFAEMHLWRKRSLLRDIYTSNQTKIGIVGAEMEWFAEGVAAEEPDKVEGFHAPGGVFYILDEAKGIKHKIWDAARGALTGTEDRMLAVSTPPLAPVGEFVRVFTHLRTTWKTFSIGPTPRQSKEWRQEREREWPKGSPEYVSKILGEIPTSATDRTIIPLNLIEAAMKRQPTAEMLKGPSRIGMDVARYGQDSTVLAFLQGKAVTRLETFSKQDTATSAKILEEALPYYDSAQIDEVAVGAGVIDPLSHHPELKKKIIPVRANDASPEPERYHNLATWMWFKFLEWLEAGGILPYDDELCSQLASREYEWHYQYGRMSRRLTSKSKLATSGKSPDKAEAVILAVVQVPRAMAVILGDKDMKEEQESLRSLEEKAQSIRRLRSQEKEAVDEAPEDRRLDRLGIHSHHRKQQFFSREKSIGFWRRKP